MMNYELKHMSEMQWWCITKFDLMSNCQLKTRNTLNDQIIEMFIRCAASKLTFVLIFKGKSLVF